MPRLRWGRRPEQAVDLSFRENPAGEQWEIGPSEQRATRRDPMRPARFSTPDPIWRSRGNRRARPPRAEPLSRPQIEADYQRRQVEQRVAAAETEASLAAERAAREAGIDPGAESSVPWRRGGAELNTGDILDRDF